MATAQRTRARTTTDAAAPAKLSDNGMTHREVLTALSGLLLGMFVSMLASTVVGTSLPLIISDLEGDQSAFTWVVTATLLATTVSTPDLGQARRPLQPQAAAAARPRHLRRRARRSPGFSQDTGTLITMRVFQGIGAGGLAALSQIVMADIISPRERGKYAGLFGAVMAVATVGGPLLGGVITDTLGWRWNFFVGLPIAIVALVLLQRTLHLPQAPKTKVTIDYLGIVLISAGVSLLLLWVTLRRQGLRVDLRAEPPHGRRRRPAAPDRRDRRAPREGARHPARPVQEPHVHALGDRVDLGRRGDVRHRGVPQPVHAARPRRDAHRVGPAHHPDDGGRAHLLDRHRRPREPPRQVEGLHGHGRRAPRDRQPAALAAPLRHRVLVRRRLDVRARRGRRHAHAEPRARRAEHHRGAEPGRRHERASRSSAASAARSASR